PCLDRGPVQLDADICTFNLFGRGMRTVVDVGLGESTPDWSPDGRDILFDGPSRQFPAGISDIQTYDVAARATHNLTNTPLIHEIGARWSPDGERIAYTQWHDRENNDVFVMDRDGTNRRQLTHHPGIDAAPRWSQDGRTILFMSDRAPAPHISLYLMNEDGSNQRRLTRRDDAQDTRPGWVVMSHYTPEFLRPLSVSPRGGASVTWGGIKRN
ncbi:MAG: hypothetical protein ABGY41_15825, partial [Candidatus Poribacteria bacterium]